MASGPQLVAQRRDGCAFDLVALGEVMLRLDPGAGRIRAARSFEVHEGGGEYNVARALSQTFGMRSAVVTRLVDNEVGELLRGRIAAAGVSTRLIDWVDEGRSDCRNGLNFTERGYGVRAGLGVSDRRFTAISMATPDFVDWRAVLAEMGVVWFHTGGVFAGLSATTPLVAECAMRAARASASLVSFDLNYRASLWRGRGGLDTAQGVVAGLANHAEVLFGSDTLFTALMGHSRLVAETSTVGMEATAVAASFERYPHLQVVALSRRRTRTQSRIDWGGVLYWRGGVAQVDAYEGLEIWDRVGGGDAFAAGVVFGLLNDRAPEACVRLGVAAGALAMTTPGDACLASCAEVETLADHGPTDMLR